MTLRILVGLASLVVWAAPAAAQSPNGCTIPGLTQRFPTVGPQIQAAADALLLGACDAHDNCYNNCGGIPRLELHRAACDLEFALRLSTECTAIAALTTAIDPDAAEEVRMYCQDVVIGIYGAVVLFGSHNHNVAQCSHCGRCDACERLPEPVPPSCVQQRPITLIFPPPVFCDPDDDGWVTPDECVEACLGYVEAGYCRR